MCAHHSPLSGSSTGFPETGQALRLRGHWRLRGCAQAPRTACPAHEHPERSCVHPQGDQGLLGSLLSSTPPPPMALDKPLLLWGPQSPRLESGGAEPSSQIHEGGNTPGPPAGRLLPASSLTTRPGPGGGGGGDHPLGQAGQELSPGQELRSPACPHLSLECHVAPLQGHPSRHRPQPAWSRLLTGEECQGRGGRLAGPMRAPQAIGARGREPDSELVGGHTLRPELARHTDQAASPGPEWLQRGLGGPTAPTAAGVVRARASSSPQGQASGRAARTSPPPDPRLVS